MFSCKSLSICDFNPSLSESEGDINPSLTVGSLLVVLGIL